jgi:hypothetical protein
METTGFFLLTLWLIAALPPTNEPDGSSAQVRTHGKPPPDARRAALRNRGDER